MLPACCFAAERITVGGKVKGRENTERNVAREREKNARLMD